MYARVAKQAELSPTLEHTVLTVCLHRLEYGPIFHSPTRSQHLLHPVRDNFRRNTTVFFFFSAVFTLFFFSRIRLSPFEPSRAHSPSPLPPCPELRPEHHLRRCALCRHTAPSLDWPWGALCPLPLPSPYHRPPAAGLQLPERVPSIRRVPHIAYFQVLTWFSGNPICAE